MSKADTPAPLVFPKKGDAHPPADADARAAIAAPAVASTGRKAKPGAKQNAAFNGRLQQHAGAIAERVAQAARPAAGFSTSTPAPELELFAPDLEGRDDLVQINITVPRWIRAQLKVMTATGQAKSIKAVTTDAIIKAVQELAEKSKAAT